MAEYQEPVKITVEMSPSFTLAALNKCLIITDEHKTGGETSANEIKVFSSSKEVGEWFGNNAKVFKAVEFFLGQKRYPSRQPLIPDSFVILSVSSTTTTKDKVLEALNTLALGQEFYAVASILPDSTLAAGDLNSWLNENRKIQFAKTKIKTVAENIKSDRFIQVYNTKDDEYKEIAYMATCITPGAGSKSDMNILSMCTSENFGGDRTELTAQGINVVERRTSKDYVVVRTGIATDGTDITETTAIDCVIYNLIDNLEILLAEKGVKMDSRGIADLEDTIGKVMGEMYLMGIVADTNGQADFKILPTEISATDRQLKRIRPHVQFLLSDYAKLVDLVLERTLESTL
ncbi:MAG: hypothetical protein RSB50_06300 [Cetobacterium sp.]